MAAKKSSAPKRKSSSSASKARKPQAQMAAKMLGEPMPASRNPKNRKMPAPGKTPTIYSPEPKDKVAFNRKHPQTMVSLGKDKNGFYVFTHAARSESFDSPTSIPKDVIDYLEDAR